MFDYRKWNTIAVNMKIFHVQICNLPITNKQYYEWINSWRMLLITILEIRKPRDRNKWDFNMLLCMGGEFLS